jgi:TPR repeat protein
MTGRLLFAHGLLWRSDAWYRRAWHIAPQIGAVVTAGWLLTYEPAAPVNPPAAPGGWGAPIPDDQISKAAESLRVRAATEPSAFRDLQALADLGDPLMQYQLATLYDPTRKLSKLVAPSMKTAARYYLASAEKGNIHAAYSYGSALIFGIDDMPKDVAAGDPWMFKAAQAGYPAAERVTGILNRDGIGGVAQNESWALQWFRKAADQGDTYSAAEIGAALWNGTPPYAKDPAQAFGWFTKAAVDPLNVPPHVSLGLYLGLAYRDGIGVATDQTLALQWFQQAADRGDTNAATDVASAYWNGTAPYRKDGALAVQWYLKAAADPANDVAAISLGDAYRDAFGVQQNIPESLKWFRRAADRGSPYAAAEIGFAYLNGTPPYTLDYGAAAKWLAIAATAATESASQRELGVSYRDGRGVERDPQKARYWFGQATANGDTSAADLLRQMK